MKPALAVPSGNSVQPLWLQRLVCSHSMMKTSWRADIMSSMNKGTVHHSSAFGGNTIQIQYYFMDLRHRNSLLVRWPNSLACCATTPCKERLSVRKLRYFVLSLCKFICWKCFIICIFVTVLLPLRILPLMYAVSISLPFLQVFPLTDISVTVIVTGKHWPQVSK